MTKGEKTNEKETNFKFTGNYFTYHIRSFLAGAIDLAAEEQHLMQRNANPYVQQYLKERGTISDDNSLLNNTEQRAADMETLIEIYREDIGVGNILQKYLLRNRSPAPTDFIAEACSLDRKQVIDTMHRIESIYSLATEEEQEAMFSYLLHHARACEDSQSIEFLENLKITDPVQLAANYTYSGTAAKDYALNWWHRFNTAQYPNMEGMGGDCTNFVSQCMKAGGIPMDSSWYCYKKNSTYLRPVNGTQLDYSWNLKKPKNPWTSLAEFTSYWQPRTPTSYYSKDYYRSNHNSIYNSSIALGDIVVLCGGLAGAVTWGEHAMIISAYDTTNKDFKLAGHSNARNYYPLLTIFQENGYTGVEFYQF